MKEWNAAQANLHKAEKFISLIGRPQRTSLDAVGKIHAVRANVTLHFQETDGAKNYHECEEFDRAFSQAVRNNFDTLAKEALEALKAKVRFEGIKARQEVMSMLATIDSYNPD